MILGLRRTNPYRELEKRLGYKFSNRDLLEMALLHRSYRYEVKDVARDNQRLEFLGDAVAGFLVAAQLYRLDCDGDEGILTELRSRVTSGKAMANVARDIQLGDFMRLGKGEEMAGGRKREALLADGLEAVIGAAYLDGGVKAAEKIVATLLIPLLGETLSDDWMGNPKGKLQELSQGLYSCGPEYKCISEEGPAHRKVFVVEAIVGGARLGQGSGPSKRVAETEAAIVGVRKLLAGK